MENFYFFDDFGIFDEFEFEFPYFRSLQIVASASTFEDQCINLQQLPKFLSQLQASSFWKCSLSSCDLPASHEKIPL